MVPPVPVLVRRSYLLLTLIILLMLLLLLLLLLFFSFFFFSFFLLLLLLLLLVPGVKDAVYRIPQVLFGRCEGGHGGQQEDSHLSLELGLGKNRRERRSTSQVPARCVCSGGAASPGPSTGPQPRSLAPLQAWLSQAQA